MSRGGPPWPASPNPPRLWRPPEPPPPPSLTPFSVTEPLLEPPAACDAGWKGWCPLAQFWLVSRRFEGIPPCGYGWLFFEFSEKRTAI